MSKQLNTDKATAAIDYIMAHPGCTTVDLARNLGVVQSSVASLLCDISFCCYLWEEKDGRICRYYIDYLFDERVGDCGDLFRAIFGYEASFDMVNPSIPTRVAVEEQLPGTSWAYLVIEPTGFGQMRYALVQSR